MTFKLTPLEARDLWVKALRGGEYKQTSLGALRDDTGHCCLGVGCDLYIKHEGEGSWEVRDEGEPYIFKVGGEASNSFLPEKVRLWLGLKSTDGSWAGAHERGAAKPAEWGHNATLAGLNDFHHTFASIADRIEAGEVGFEP